MRGYKELETFLERIKTVPYCPVYFISYIIITYVIYYFCCKS